MNLKRDKERLEFFLDAKNIPNQVLVKDTVRYIEEGPRRDLFNVETFLNLLWFHYNNVLRHSNEPEIVMEALNYRSLTTIKKHVLCGFILKWYGGYPIKRFNDRHHDLLKQIERIFLEFPEATPEKEFCKADMNRRKKMMKLEIAGNAAINNGLLLGEVLKELQDQEEEPNSFANFEDLFNFAIRDGIIAPISEPIKKSIECARLQYKFNVWLHDDKLWEYGDDISYESYLTAQTFKQFIIYENQSNAMKEFLNGISPKEAFYIFAENHKKLETQFRVKRKATKEDVLQINGLKEGDPIEYYPDYKTPREAYALLTGLFGRTYCEYEKFHFVERYKVWNQETIRGEIAEIEIFVQKADNEGLSIACDSYGRNHDKPQFVFKRLKAGFYGNLEVNRYPLISAYGNIEARIYGRYFLFYNYLQQLVEPSLEQPITKEETAIENKFCKLMPLEIALDHFSVFTTSLSANGKPFLNKPQFDAFIKRAFRGDRNVPKQSFNLAPRGEKLLVQSVFYEFYNTYCLEYFFTTQCRRQFLRLLTDNFKGWDYGKVKDNFSPKTRKRLK